MSEEDKTLLKRAKELEVEFANREKTPEQKKKIEELTAWWDSELTRPKPYYEILVAMEVLREYVLTQKRLPIIVQADSPISTRLWAFLLGDYVSKTYPLAFGESPAFLSDDTFFEKPAAKFLEEKYMALGPALAAAYVEEEKSYYVHPTQIQKWFSLPAHLLEGESAEVCEFFRQYSEALGIFLNPALLEGTAAKQLQRDALVALGFVKESFEAIEGEDELSVELKLCFEFCRSLFDEARLNDTLEAAISPDTLPYMPFKASVSDAAIWFHICKDVYDVEFNQRSFVSYSEWSRCVFSCVAYEEFLTISNFPVEGRNLRGKEPEPFFLRFADGITVGETNDEEV